MGLDYTIEYKKGRENKVADALYRRENVEGNEMVVNAVTQIVPSWIEELKGSYEGEKWAQDNLEGTGKAAMEGKVTVHGGVIWYKGGLYLGPSKEWGCKRIQLMHDSRIGRQR